MSRADMRNRSIADQRLIDMGLARQIYDNWMLQGQNQKAWWFGYYKHLERTEGRKYAEHIKGLIRLVKQERFGKIPREKT